MKAQGRSYHPLSHRTPRACTTIFIFNGVLLDPALCSTYNRVRRLLVRENGTPLALLALQDTPATPSIKTPLLRNGANGTSMILSFEIRHPYVGSCSIGTAITEFWFEGIDVQ